MASIAIVKVMAAATVTEQAYITHCCSYCLSMGLQSENKNSS